MAYLHIGPYPDDIRLCKAYFEDGSEFDDLFVVGKWQNHPHSLDQRKAANALINRNNLKEDKFRDPIKDYENHLITNSRNNKLSRNKLGALKETMTGNNSLLPLNSDHDHTDMANTNSIKTNKLLSVQELDARFHKNDKLIKYNI